jgi:hypothetical protein
MKLKLDELPPQIKALNPHLFVGSVEEPFTQPNLARALDGQRPAHQASEGCVVVSLVRYGRRRLDDDNLAGGFKPLRDAIARSLDMDDGDRRLRWEYGQIETRGEQGTAVKIEVI